MEDEQYRHDTAEEGIEIPLERIDPAILQALLADFVSREWSELSDAGFTLEEKIEQVLQQLRSGQARILFDLTSSSWNIVPTQHGL
ncbi:MAG: YheU family protein [Trichlorobacter sp.]|uniref:YheU family protein n=1 Tax=Trichlorobacter sp. TaxID=2911007 RepID=UPI002560F3C2|nr:YheU family protein [Trichlorobacter sp.]MDK9719161.1 YheU family protein [Trichlorobacter sp.]